MMSSRVMSVWYYALVIAVFMLSDCATAHSQASRPLKRLVHPSTLSIEIFPRTRSSHLESRHLDSKTNILQHSDSFRLVLTAFDEKFYLHLRPNDHLIHPAARITFFSPEGEKQSEPLLRESVKAYLGETIHESHTASRMREDTAGVAHYSNEGELGWARIIAWHQGDDTVSGGSPVFEGAFSARGVIYHVMTKDNYLKSKGDLDVELGVNNGGVSDLDENLVIWRDSDLMSAEEEAFAKGLDVNVKPQTCGHDRLEGNKNFGRNELDGEWLDVDSHDPAFGLGPLGNSSLVKRQGDAAGNGMSTNFVNSIGSTDGCPTTQKILFMGVAADCEYVTKYGSKENATQKILNNWNMASALYKQTFNVSLGIVELQVQNPQCPGQPDPNLPWNTNCAAAKLDERSSIFSQWRGDKGNDGIGLWHLMSGCPTGSEVGIAWLGTLCQQSSSGKPGSVVSGAGVSTGGITEWQVVAHEIGHNFGAIHDCTDGCQTNGASNCCPLQSATNCNANSGFIMSPIAQTSEQFFSKCSIGNVCSLMKGISSGKTDTSCLIDPGTSTRQTFALKMCGNGIVEPGEDCDPGAGTNSTCCDASTCKFKNGAVCDPLSSPCCTGQCGFAPSTQVCRPSKDDRCDSTEMCTGTSSACPKDVVKPNGQSCGDNGLACASGLCTSVAQQCQSVGASMGLKNACPRNENSCRISCQDPNKSNTCVVLSSLLVDGSPCGFGGTCFSGNCQAGSLLDTAKAWYTQNLQIAIPVTIVAGILIMLMLIALIKSICGCMNRNKTYNEPVVVTSNMGTHQRLGSQDPIAGLRGLGPYPTYMPQQAPQPPPSYNSNPRADWVDERTYNGR